MRVLKGMVVLTLVAGLFASGAFAVAPLERQAKYESANPQIVETVPPGPPVFFSDACPATDVGMLDDLGTIISGDTCSSANDYENDGGDCSYGAGGNDEIFQFTVGTSGLWQLDTFNFCAGWDTSIMVREETGGGCPGDFLACDGDGGHGVCGNYESALQTYLYTGTTYYLVVDGWSTFTCGVFDAVGFLIEELCVDDTDCDDGVFCNGAEYCDAGVCTPGANPCLDYQACDEDAAACTDPDACMSWLAGPGSNFFFPYANTTPGIWLGDDIELERGCTDTPAILNYYQFNMLARAIGTNPVGTPYFMDLALFDVEPVTCLPLAEIPGSQCAGLGGFIEPGGTPADALNCAPGPIALPDNSGDFDRCEIDFFIAYRGNELGAGFGIAGGEQVIGGLAARDDFGVDVFFLEDYPGAGTWGASWFGDDVGTPADFEGAMVCTDNVGVCCEGLDVCTEGVLEADCAGDWTPCVFWDPPTCADPDGDGMFTICGDNCPGVANADQADCDGGVTPEGDACETNADYQDDDGDGVCNVDDACPDNGFITVAGVCACTDTSSNLWNGVDDPQDDDGDFTADCIDGCPNDPNKIVPGVCGCGTLDTDSDGDGVADCLDQCAGVDDAVFAPGCAGAIPTVSEWGLVILALLLLVAGKVYFGRRAATS